MKEKQKQWNRNWMNKQRKHGLCIFCKEKKFGDSALCQKHFFYSVATSSLKDGTRWEILRDMFYAQDEKCYLSGRKLIAGRNASIDHLLPVSRNLKMKKRIENLRWCDKEINYSKRDMTANEFICLCKEVVNNNS